MTRFAFAILFALLSSGPDAEAQEPVRIYAAASTAGAVTEIARRYEAAGRGAVETVFAASSSLARQIEYGAPADIFLSANETWMDHLEASGAIRAGTRRDLLKNRLVLVTPRGRTFTWNPAAPAAGDALLGHIGKGRLALCEPSHVPCGIYAKEALESLGLWPRIAERTVFAADARAAYAWVARGEAAAGILYASDVTGGAAVAIAAAFPESSHAPIVYPIALVAGADGNRARTFLDYLLAEEAARIFAAHGFGRAEDRTSDLGAGPPS